MRVGILGPTEARPDGVRPVAAGGPGLRALLALLALGAGRTVAVERLIDGLYGDEPPTGGVNALQAQVSRLRRHLGDLVVREPAGYRLAVEPDDVDASRFERLAAEGRRALAAGDQATAAALLRDALGLWRGPALADVTDAPFAAAQAARLEDLRLAAAEDLAEAGLALGRHADLLAELRERVAAHPLRERSRGQLMRALYAAGHQAEALAVFEDGRRMLADELGADPSPELAAVHLAVLRGDPALSPSPARVCLPAQLTPLVGRDADLDRIASLLAGSRLVTLTGPGGTGKTRLAAEAAARRPGDVFFVELAALGDGADVPHAVLGALGLREGGLPAGPGPGRPAVPADPAARLVAALSARPALLVLDNCEHVVEDVARLADRLLGACPSLRVLATSREALGITGERLHPVPPLDLPPAGAPVEAALASPAVQLFADRARAVRPDFLLDAGDGDDAVVRDVVSVCRALDGLPLAIELAAARMRSLPVGEIASRLGSLAGPFSVLSRGSRTAQPRHRTLRAVVEWSWDLLDETERTLARRLTVFAGGATLEAAEAVCGLPDTDGVLASLVDKSLVEAVDGRYRMLETIRAFCAGRLAEAGEEKRFRHAHRAYVLDLGRAADPRLRGPEQVEWLRRLNAEHDNLHAAVRRAAEDGDVEGGLRLMAATLGYWMLRGLRSEAAGLAEALLAVAGPRPPAGLEEEHGLCACVAAWGSRGTAVGAWLAEAVERLDADPGMPRQPFLLVLRAMVAGPPEREALRELEHRYALMTADPWTRALSAFGLSYLKLFDGRLVEAEDTVNAAVREARAVGDRWLTAMMLSALADIADWRDDHALVVALTDEALDLVEVLGATSDVAETLCRRGAARTRMGAVAEARADYERAAALARRIGASEMLAEALLGLGELARLRGETAEARRLYESALAECTAEWFAAEETRSRVYLALGWAAQMSGDAGEALAWHRRALTTGLGERNLAMAARVAEGFAGVALLEGDPGRAAGLLGVGAALRGSPRPDDPDIRRVASQCLERIGEAAYERAYGRALTATGARMTGAAAADAGPPALALIEGHLSAFDG
ncbi:SARP family transcriptional regulator [Microbispora corallina]|uniref:SARP family transcriptional regulator n=1 Tax=Microbispora corallina TaxID=83302 RepID=A0ABQ4FSI3_9ACTN|nr:BTAD domain-containing putative transcriptional regulator [Microbispora corallina]GIH37731.1 SARP family transcriptional regulator [Microbispora corallina]